MTESIWSIDAIAEDRTKGSTFLSIRALEILRERARSNGGEWTELANLAKKLVQARPSMVVIANRIHRTMHRAHGDAGAVEREARAAIERAERADERAARRAAELLRERRIFTLSRSETVTEALVRAKPSRVVVAESLPGGEGSDVADRLKEAGLEVSLVPDAAMAVAMDEFEIDLAVVGADAVLPSGAVVNKVGTRLLALAANEESVGMYAICAEDKVSTDEAIELERTDTPGVPLFEVTPPHLFSGIITESGNRSPDAATDIAERFREYAAWMNEA